jgi:hypothetical protein
VVRRQSQRLSAWTEQPQCGKAAGSWPVAVVQTKHERALTFKVDLVSKGQDHRVCEEKEYQMTSGHRIRSSQCTDHEDQPSSQFIGPPLALARKPPAVGSGLKSQQAYIRSAKREAAVAAQQE